jgi:hypothetical protein
MKNGLITNEYAHRMWYLNNKLHREDGPAVEYYCGDKEWYINGVLHREDGPAIEYVDGERRWYINGTLHRLDGPAIMCGDGKTAWIYNGKNVEKKLNVKITSVEQYQKLINLMVFA